MHGYGAMASLIFNLCAQLVLGDHVDHYLFEFESCQVVNPGSFSCDSSFVVYRPATKTVEYSKLS
jgi:hypothetical protein